MAEDAAEPEEGAEPAASSDAEADAPPPEPPPLPRTPALSRRNIGIAAAVVAVLVIAFDFSYIMRAAHQRSAAPQASASAAPSASASESSDVAAAPMAKNAPAEEFEDDAAPSSSAEPKKPKRSERAAPGTVREAAARSCSTAVVGGLSRQIIAQTRCIDRSAFVEVPRQPNLETAPNVFLFLEASARDHLLRALRANKKNTMTVNSALRTVAQQYLLFRWSSSKRCGIEIATPPGESNHETGLALDIAEAPVWRAALEAQDFHWLGAIDRVHFDYKGPNAASRASVDVKAFQQLWNINHPDDLLVENGQFDAETSARLEQSPAKGFRQGPHCKR